MLIQKNFLCDIPTFLVGNSYFFSVEFPPFIGLFSGEFLFFVRAYYFFVRDSDFLCVIPIISENKLDYNL